MDRKINYEQALFNPAFTFEQPEDVLSCAGLTAKQRAEILRRWEYDESEVAVAVEEGMPGGEHIAAAHPDRGGTAPRRR